VTMQFHTALTAIARLPHLTRLNINSGDEQIVAALVDMQLQLPRLRGFELSNCWLADGILVKLHGCMPNLISFAPNNFHLSNLHVIPRFTQLRSITFFGSPEEMGIDERYPDPSQADHALVSVLTACAELTHLTVTADHFHSMSSWVRLFTDAPNLTSLCLINEPSDDLLQTLSTVSVRIRKFELQFTLFTAGALSILRRFTHCESFSLETELSARMTLPVLKSMFADVTLMPNLRHLTLRVRNGEWREHPRKIEWLMPSQAIASALEKWGTFEWESGKKFNGDTYRRTAMTVSSQSTPPAPRLVCIETNPGPRSRSRSRSPPRRRSAGNIASTSASPLAAPGASSSSNQQRVSIHKLRTQMAFDMEF
jgi:hypothetical protein